jgi:hypothetical protein
LLVLKIAKGGRKIGKKDNNGSCRFKSVTKKDGDAPSYSKIDEKSPDNVAGPASDSAMFTESVNVGSL